MKYKMIVADFDDTILNDDMKYSDYFKSTVNEYVQKGGRFHIATGRMTHAILPYARDIGLKGELLSYQGAVFTDIESGETIMRSVISNEVAVEMAKIIEERGMYFHVYEDDTFVVKEDSVYSDLYSTYCKCKAKALHSNISDYLTKSGLCPVKMMIMTDPDDVMPLINEFTNSHGNDLLFNTSKEFMVEILPKTISKGIAVSLLAKKYNINQSEVICIGDSLNDITMIEWAGMGVCVENGNEDVKKSADYIAPSNNDEGVSFVINKFGLEKI